VNEPKRRGGGGGRPDWWRRGGGKGIVFGLGGGGGRGRAIIIKLLSYPSIQTNKLIITQKRCNFYTKGNRKIRQGKNSKENMSS
jgi:hypothetical protein